jgi:hypothetical protein
LTGVFHAWYKLCSSIAGIPVDFAKDRADRLMRVSACPVRDFRTKQGNAVFRIDQSEDKQKVNA